MCTAISLQSNIHCFGRNLDLEYGYHETVAVTPRNYPFHFSHAVQCPSHYAMIGMATVENGFPLYYEATNECGLSAAGLNFPGLASYRKPIPGKNNIATFEFIPWLLCQCSNTDQASKLICNLNLTDTQFSAAYAPTPLHWMIADRHSCLVVEQTKEGLRCYDNPMGVMTNAPEFSFHLTNLKNYQHLSPLPPINRFTPDQDLAPYSGAMGAIGLPGDWSSASRFVRAAFIACNSPSLPTEHQCINQFFRILQAVAMPMGCVQIKPGLYDITRYSSCCDTQSCKYYYTTYENSRITCVDMYSYDLMSDKVISIPLRTSPDIFTETHR